MNTTALPLAAGDAAGGYWTIQVICRDHSEPGGRYVCHARDEAEARLIAGRLTGSSSAVIGFDYHRIDNPLGRYARQLELGHSERVTDAVVWTVLASARRSA